MEEFFDPRRVPSPQRLDCVPTDNDIRRQSLYEYHDSPSAGHTGIRKTYALVRRQFYWPSLHKDVQHYVTHCTKCQVNKDEHLITSIRNSQWEMGEYLYGCYSMSTNYHTRS